MQHHTRQEEVTLSRSGNTRTDEPQPGSWPSWQRWLSSATVPQCLSPSSVPKENPILLVQSDPETGQNAGWITKHSGGQGKKSCEAGWWWCTPLIPVLRRQEWVDFWEFKASLGYLVRSSLKNKTKHQKKQKQKQKPHNTNKQANKPTTKFTK